MGDRGWDGLLQILPFVSPGVRNAANNRTEHESGDEGEENKVDEAFQSIVAQSRHGLDVILEQEQVPLFLMTNQTKQNKNKKPSHVYSALQT